MQRVPRVAIIGVGYWGKNVARNLAELGVLKTVCDAQSTAAVEFANKYGAEFIADSDAVLADKSIDAIAIATPAVTHDHFVRRALSAGKDVFVEKPLALSAPVAAELGRLATQEGRLLMVGHVLRYHPAFEKLASLVTSGELGRVNYISSSRHSLGKLRTEENVLWSFAPHDVSMILALANSPVTSVASWADSFVQPNVADRASLRLGFADGLRANISVSWLHPFKEHRLVVTADNIMAVFDDTLTWDHKLTLYRHSIRWDGLVPIVQPAKGEPVTIDAAEPLRSELSHFIACVAERTTPRTDASEGTRVLEVLELAERSMADGGTQQVLPPTAKP